MSDKDYEKKYLMYKQKYLNSKQYEKEMLGGSSNKLSVEPDNKSSLILYKANWCIHCKKFKPVWKELKQKYSNISFKEYDADLHKNKMTQENITGYPTIHFINNSGNKIEYNGQRDIQNITNFLSKYNI